MPAVTVAIPTRNRARFLKRAISSVCSQTFADYELLVVDNASEDETNSLVADLAHPKIRYFRNDSDCGMIRNWNRCLELANGELVTILGDDDVLATSFLEDSIVPHRMHPNLGFTYTHCTKIDQSENAIQRWGYQFAPSGLMAGSDYILWSARFGCCLTHSSSVLLKVDAARRLGGFRAEVAANTFDFNLWLRLAMHYPAYFLDRNLVQCTIHDEQISAHHWRGERQTGRVGARLELISVLSKLLEAKQKSIELGDIGELIQKNNTILSTLLRSEMPDL